MCVLEAIDGAVGAGAPPRHPTPYGRDENTHTKTHTKTFKHKTRGVVGRGKSKQENRASVISLQL